VRAEVFYGSEVGDDDVALSFGAVSFNKYIPTFRRNILSPSSGMK
jgi:hypothetical protein